MLKNRMSQRKQRNHRTETGAATVAVTHHLDRPSIINQTLHMQIINDTLFTQPVRSKTVFKQKPTAIGKFYGTLPRKLVGEHVKSTKLFMTFVIVLYGNCDIFFCVLLSIKPGGRLARKYFLMQLIIQKEIRRYPLKIFTNV